MPSPPLLNFVAGLFAAAGINMLTSVATGPIDTSTTAIAVDASVWTLAAVATTVWAHYIETANRAAEQLIRESLQPPERAGIHASARAKVAGRVRLWMITSVALFAAGVLLIPHLLALPW